MVSIVTCEISPGRGSRATLYIQALDNQEIDRINALNGVNIGDDRQTIIDKAVIAFGSDPVVKGAKITLQHQISLEELTHIINRTNPTISKVFLEIFPSLLST